MTKDCRRSRFLERVLTAISNLGALRGSSARDILNYLLSSCADKSSSRNLTLQLQHALKQAVISGLLKLQGDRYKICKSSAPVAKNVEETTTTKRKKKKKKKKKRKNSRRTREKRGENSEAASGAEKGDSRSSGGHRSKSEKNPSAK